MTLKDCVEIRKEDVKLMKGFINKYSSLFEEYISGIKKAERKQ